MANAYGKLGVRSNCVCPGYTDTPMIADVIDIFEDEQTADYLTPMSRPGTPEEMAFACLYLGSDEASYCNGSFCRLMGVQWLDNRIVILLYFGNYLLIGYPLLLLKMSRYRKLSDFFHITIYLANQPPFHLFL